MAAGRKRHKGGLEQHKGGLEQHVLLWKGLCCLWPRDVSNTLLLKKTYIFMFEKSQE